MAGSGDDNFAREYGRVLARDGVELEIRNAAARWRILICCGDPAFGMQAAFTTFGFFEPAPTRPIGRLRSASGLIFVRFWGDPGIPRPLAPNRLRRFLPRFGHRPKSWARL